jgi:hypothetical protein
VERRDGATGRCLAALCALVDLLDERGLGVGVVLHVLPVPRRGSRLLATRRYDSEPVGRRELRARTERVVEAAAAVDN